MFHSIVYLGCKTSLVVSNINECRMFTTGWLWLAVIVSADSFSGDVFVTATVCCVAVGDVLVVLSCCQ